MTGTRTRRASRWRVAGAFVAGLLLLLALAQIVLPRIAVERLRSRLSAHGSVLAVSVSAFPAIELLWGQADSVTVRMGSYRDSPAAGRPRARGHKDSPPALDRLGDFLASTGDTDSLDARAGSVQLGRLILEDAVLSKRGDQLAASGLLTRSRLQAALPRSLSLDPLASSGGSLLFRGGVELAGIHATTVARLRARHGALVVQPDVGGAFPGFLSITVYRDPRVYVESISTRRTSGGWIVSAQARLVGE